MIAKDKDQQEFEAHCKEHLNMSVHLRHAQECYHLAYDNEVKEYKKANSGLRAMNLYLLMELKKIGWQDWRKDKNGNKPVRRNVIAKPSEADMLHVSGKKSDTKNTGYLNRLINEATTKR